LLGRERSLLQARTKERIFKKKSNLRKAEKSQPWRERNWKRHLGKQKSASGLWRRAGKKRKTAGKDVGLKR